MNYDVEYKQGMKNKMVDSREKLGSLALRHNSRPAMTGKTDTVDSINS